MKKCRPLLSIVALSLCCILVGCNAVFPPYLSKTSQLGLVGTAGGAAVGAYTMGLGAPLGALAGGVVSTTVAHFIEKNQTVLERLHEQGIQVVAVGDNVLLIIPSSIFFYPHSPNRMRNFDPVLNDIAALLRAYEKVTVKVSAYTDNSGDPLRAKTLTEQQAHSIANYLWKHNIDTRILYAVGYGGMKPISTNHTPEGRAQNSRIEITLRQLS